MKKIFILIIICFIFLLTSCNKNTVSINGEKNFIFTNYIYEDETSISNIVIPFIFNSSIKEFEIEKVKTSLNISPVIELLGINYIANYKNYNLYHIVINITEIHKSFTILEFIFNINSNVNVKYNPNKFVVTVVENERIKEIDIYSEAIKYNNMPEIINYRIDNLKMDNINSYYLKSFHLYDKAEFDETNEQMENENYFKIILQNLDYELPLSFTFNFELILNNGEKDYSVILNNIKVVVFAEARLVEIIDRELEYKNG